MSNSFTLDDLNAALERKYSPLVFDAGDEQYTLQSLMRLSKDTRKSVITAMKVMQAGEDDDDFDEDETLEALEFVLASVVKGGYERGRKMVEMFNHDLATLMEVMTHWQEKTQPGEAQPSQS